MSNRFEDIEDVRDIFRALLVWGRGNYGETFINQLVEEAYERLEEILYSDEEKDQDVEFKKYVRKPFIVSAVEITEENIEELSELIGEFGTDKNGPFIQADPEKVPTVQKVVPGYWVTKMGSNIRCYSPQVFQASFVEGTPKILNKSQEIIKA